MHGTQFVLPEKWITITIHVPCWLATNQQEFDKQCVNWFSIVFNHKRSMSYVRYMDYHMPMAVTLWHISVIAFVLQSHYDIFPEHKVVEIAVYKTEASRLDKRYCRLHGNEELSLGCTVCYKVICIQCLPDNTYGCIEGETMNIFTTRTQEWSAADANSCQLK